MKETVISQPSSWRELSERGSGRFKLYYVDWEISPECIRVAENAWLQEGKIVWIDEWLHKHHETIPYNFKYDDVVFHNGRIFGLNKESVKDCLIKTLRQNREKINYALKKLSPPKYFPSVDRKALLKTICVIFGVIGFLACLACAPQVACAIIVMGLIVIIGGMVYIEFKEMS